MTMPEQKKAVVPRLRFPEFRDAGPWEVKRLGEVFCERSERGGNGLELLSVTISDGVVRAAELERKNNANADLSNYKKVCPGDIVYNSMRMWQGASGVSWWHGVVSPAYTVVTPKESQNAVFWAYCFKLEHSIAEFVRFSQGVTSDTWNLKYPAFSAIEMAFPAEQAEQQKIADCLSSLDELIKLQAKQLEALKAHKKGLMQQLFPREGETTPRLRFPEFRDAGPWEVKRLETIVELAYGAALPESHRNKGDVPVVGSNGIVGYHDKPLTKGPTIVIGRKGSAGEVTWVEEACFPIDTTFFVQFRRSLDSPRFLYFLLLTLNLPELARAEGIPGLNRNDVYSRRVGVPSAAEQQKIADCLSSLDELIELQAKQLEALQTHKKGLMQQLFPQEIDL